MKDMKVYGAENLMKVLKELPNELGVKAIDSATRKGAKHLKDNAEQDFNKPKGFAIERDKKSKATSAFKIGPNDENWHLIFREFGTKPHLIERKSGLVNYGDGEFFGTEVSHPGVMADPVFRNMFERERKKAVNIIIEQLGKTVERAAVKLSKKYKDSGLVKKRRKKR